MSATARGHGERFPFGDEELSIPEIAARTGVAYATLRYRIKHLGMTADDAGGEPLRRGTQAGKPKVCRSCGIPGHNAAKCRTSTARAA